MKPKNWETKNVLIDKKNYNDLVIYFTRHNGGTSIRLLSLYYNELIGMIKECEEKKYLIVRHCTLNKVLEKVKEIKGIEKFDDTKILIHKDYKLTYYVCYVALYDKWAKRKAFV